MKVDTNKEVMKKVAFRCMPVDKVSCVVCEAVQLTGSVMAEDEAMMKDLICDG